MFFTRYNPDTSIGGAGGRFPSTRPSLVDAAARPATPAQRVAFGALVDAYWKPIYKYVRFRWNSSNEDAKDLTQAFFAELLDGPLLSRFDPARASFRTYIRVCIDGFVANRRERDSRLKRGGGAVLVSMTDDGVRQQLPPDPTSSIDAFFHRVWQRQMFELGIRDLRSHAAETGRLAAVAVFEAHDLADNPPSYAALARRFGVSEATVTNQLAWARRELRRLVLRRVDGLAASPAQFARDARAIFGASR